MSDEERQSVVYASSHNRVKSRSCSQRTDAFAILPKRTQARAGRESHTLPCACSPSHAPCRVACVVTTVGRLTGPRDLSASHAKASTRMRRQISVICVRQSTAWQHCVRPSGPDHIFGMFIAVIVRINRAWHGQTSRITYHCQPLISYDPAAGSGGSPSDRCWLKGGPGKAGNSSSNACILILHQRQLPDTWTAASGPASCRSPPQQPPAPGGRRGPSQAPPRPPPDGQPQRPALTRPCSVTMPARRPSSTTGKNATLRGGCSIACARQSPISMFQCMAPDQHMSGPTRLCSGHLRVRSAQARQRMPGRTAPVTRVRVREQAAGPARACARGQEHLGTHPRSAGARAAQAGRRGATCGSECRARAAPAWRRWPSPWTRRCAACGASRPRRACS